MSILRVALPIPMRRLFDYLINGPIPDVGCRVRVPFGNRQMIGVVMGTAEESEFDQSKLKGVSEVLDQSPVLSATSMSLCRWLSQYYQHPIGDVVSTALPAALRKGESAEPKAIGYLAATEQGRQSDLSSLKRAPRQMALLTCLFDGDIPMSEARIMANASSIKALIEKSLAEEVQRLPEPPEDFHETLKIADKPVANVQQSLAITGITQQLSSYETFLLEGVTGSGKTEVYLQCIESVLKNGQQVLVLVPEIGLTPQTVSRFRDRFGIDVGVLHSNLSDTERLAVWKQAADGKLGIVIGTRSAIFTPLKSPGMLIVDEEHDASYKQQDGLRYNARDLAVVRAREENIPLILGTATPSLESLNNALQNRYQHFTLEERAGSATHTRQQVMDITDQPLQFGLASGMISRIRQHLQQGSQVMLFINRRGFAPALVCHSCGHVENCRSCDKPYTMHRQLNKLQCHHCGAAKAISPACQSCGSTDIAPVGVGTEQLQDGLKQLFPEYKTIRIDSDSTRGKTRLSELLDDVNSNRYQILVGTQILSKGHHFPNVTLVVIMDTDGALFSADFRASENLAQLITQLSGRAGRAEKPGEMWLQTHQPGHPLLQDLIHNGYAHFARHALLEREHASLPPYQYQALFRAEATDPRQAHQFLKEIAGGLPQTEGIAVIGPMPALMEKRQGRFRLQLLVQSNHRGRLQSLLHHNLPIIEGLVSARKVRWSIDVDPQDFM